MAPDCTSLRPAVFSVTLANHTTTTTTTTAAAATTIDTKVQIKVVP